MSKYYNAFLQFYRKNLLVIIMILLLCPILAITYSSFVIRTNNYRASEMYIGNLLYSIKINEVSTNTISVPPGETEIIVKVTSLNVFNTKYKIIYSTNPNISMIYANDENEPTYGLITTSKTSTILVSNSSEENLDVTLFIAGGYKSSELGSIDILEGYTEIANDYMKYDYETLALYVDNVRVDELDNDMRYELISYTCTNNETVLWNKYDAELRIYPVSRGTKCQLYFNASEEIITYSKLIESYSCSNSSVGVEPFIMSYTGECDIIDDGDDNWIVKFYTTGNLRFKNDIPLDVFVVGGGGNGGPSNGNGIGGSGGGGGEAIATTLYAKRDVNNGVTVGDVASYSRYNYIVADGGTHGVSAGKGGDGGSGGGSSAVWDSIAGAGGSDGGNGENAYASGGIGQILTTREFGDPDGKIYGAGGGGGGGTGSPGGTSDAGNGGSKTGSGTNAVAHTGCGGGGGGSTAGALGGAGASGIVMIRNARNKSIDLLEILYNFDYTGNYIAFDDGNGDWRIKFYTNGDITFAEDTTVEAFLVGGGGAGGSGNASGWGGAGGGGGYTLTSNMTFNQNIATEVTIGLGSQSTYLGNLEALPGINGGPGGSGTGGNGGSGGGALAQWSAVGGVGGSNGSAGTAGTGTSTPGNGQGTSTYEFGEMYGELYSGGGGGGGGTGGLGGTGGGGNGGNGSTQGINGIPFTGGGGGGGGSGNGATTLGGTGGCGIVVIRNIR